MVDLLLYLYICVINKEIFEKFVIVKFKKKFENII